MKGCRRAAGMLAVMILGWVVMLAGCSDNHVGAASKSANKDAGDDTAPSVAAPDRGAKSSGTESDQVAVAATPEVRTPAQVAEPAKATETPQAVPPAVSETRNRAPAKRAGGSAAGLVEITFDTLKFDMKTKEEPFRRDMLTKEIEALNGKSVRLRGYILPSFQQRGLTQFVMMRDNMECCFGPGAWIYDCVIVEMNEGKSADYTVRPVTVEGTFEVREFLDADGKHLAVYHIAGDSAK